MVLFPEPAGPSMAITSLRAALIPWDYPDGEVQVSTVESCGEADAPPTAFQGAVREDSLRTRVRYGVRAPCVAGGLRRPAASPVRQRVRSRARAQPAGR